MLKCIESWRKALQPIGWPWTDITTGVRLGTIGKGNCFFHGLCQSIGKLSRLPQDAPLRRGSLTYLNVDYNDPQSLAHFAETNVYALDTRTVEERRIVLTQLLRHDIFEWLTQPSGLDVRSIILQKSDFIVQFMNEEVRDPAHGTFVTTPHEAESIIDTLNLERYTSVEEILSAPEFLEVVSALKLADNTKVVRQQTLETTWVMAQATMQTKLQSFRHILAGVYPLTQSSRKNVLQRFHNFFGVSPDTFSYLPYPQVITRSLHSMDEALLLAERSINAQTQTYFSSTEIEAIRLRDPRDYTANGKPIIPLYVEGQITEVQDPFMRTISLDSNYFTLSHALVNQDYDMSYAALAKELPSNRDVGDYIIRMVTEITNVSVIVVQCYSHAITLYSNIKIMVPPEAACIVMEWCNYNHYESFAIGSVGNYQTYFTGSDPFIRACGQYEAALIPVVEPTKDQVSDEEEVAATRFNTRRGVPLGWHLSASQARRQVPVEVSTEEEEEEDSVLLSRRGGIRAGQVTRPIRAPFGQPQEVSSEEETKQPDRRNPVRSTRIARTPRQVSSEEEEVTPFRRGRNLFAESTSDSDSDGILSRSTRQPWNRQYVTGIREYDNLLLFYGLAFSDVSLTVPQIIRQIDILQTTPNKYVTLEQGMVAKAQSTWPQLWYKYFLLTGLSLQYPDATPHELNAIRNDLTPEEVDEYHNLGIDLFQAFLHPQ